MIYKALKAYHYTKQGKMHFNLVRGSYPLKTKLVATSNLCSLSKYMKILGVFIKLFARQWIILYIVTYNICNLLTYRRNTKVDPKAQCAYQLTT